MKLAKPGDVDDEAVYSESSNGDGELLVPHPLQVDEDGEPVDDVDMIPIAEAFHHLTDQFYAEINTLSERVTELENGRS